MDEVSKKLPERLVEAKVVAAQEFRLIHDNRIRVRLYVDKDGVSCLDFLNRDGKLCIGLSVDNDGSDLCFWDQKHKNRIRLYMETDGSPDLSFWDQDGKLIWSAP